MSAIQRFFAGIGSTITGIVIAILVIILLMQERGTPNWVLRILLGAYDVYGVTGWLSDILSYSRLLALGIEGAKDFEERSAALYREHEALIAEKGALLKAKGYAEDYDMPVFECKECNDTGFVGKTLCSCFKKIRAKRAYYASGLGKALAGQTFESIDMRYYGGTTPGGLPVKTIMTNNIEYCKAYANSFKAGAENLLIIGGAGLGKTHVSSAIGHVVINKGYNVVYESAQNIVVKMIEECVSETGCADVKAYLKDKTDFMKKAYFKKHDIKVIKQEGEK